MSTIVIGCGGTGNRVIRASLYWIAAGARLRDKECIYPVLVDADTTGSALSACDATLANYINVSTGYSGKIFPANLGRLTHFRKWHPQTGQGPLSVRKSLSGHDEAELLMQACFSPLELKQEITGGFFGRPALGAGSMKRQIKSADRNDFWSRFERQPEVSSAKRFVLTGSIFGGTGAATMPFIIERLRDSFPNARISVVLLLPYFTFDFSPEQKRLAESEGHLLPEPDQFMGNALVAMDQYLDKLSGSIDDIYIIGDSHPENNNLSRGIVSQRLGSRVGISRGGADQRTPMFFHDMLAGSAILDVLQRSEAPGRPAERNVYIAGVDPMKIGWSQLPSPCVFSTSAENSHALAVFSRFTYLALLLVDPWLSKKGVDEADERRIPFIADLHSDHAGNLIWKQMAEFLHGFREALLDIEVNSGTTAKENGFIHFDAWSRHMASPTLNRIEAAAQFAGVVKELRVRRGSLVGTWNSLCEPVGGFADLTNRLYDLAEANLFGTAESNLPKSSK